MATNCVTATADGTYPMVFNNVVVADADAPGDLRIAGPHVSRQ